MNIQSSTKFVNLRRAAGVLASFALIFALLSGLSLPVPFNGEGTAPAKRFSLTTPVGANTNYYNFSGGNLSLTLTSSPSVADLIDANNDWSLVNYVEGYKGDNLSAEGTDPQLVTNTEFVSNILPIDGSETFIQANKGNTSAVNNGGLAEFDRAPDALDICYGFQGNVQSDNPYMVFYINTTGYNDIKMSYRVRDVDAGNNSSVSAIALQYRIGNTGPFINLSDGYIADATQGPNIKGLVTTRNVTLPAAVNNQPQVQIRLITSNAAGPDEWIGVNNIIIGPFAPTAASVNVGGQVISPYGRPLMNATISLFDSYGNVRTAITNPFGFYRFEDVSAGETYIVEIRSKRYSFPEATRTLFVTEDMDSVNFAAEPIGESPKAEPVSVKASTSLRKSAPVFVDKENMLRRF
jgi:hypothetical protein